MQLTYLCLSYHYPDEIVVLIDAQLHELFWRIFTHECPHDAMHELFIIKFGVLIAINILSPYLNPIRLHLSVSILQKSFTFINNAILIWKFMWVIEAIQLISFSVAFWKKFLRIISTFQFTSSKKLAYTFLDRMLRGKLTFFHLIFEMSLRWDFWILLSFKRRLLVYQGESKALTSF